MLELQSFFQSTYAANLQKGPELALAVLSWSGIPVPFALVSQQMESLPYVLCQTMWLLAGLALIKVVCLSFSLIEVQVTAGLVPLIIIATCLSLV